MNRKSRIRRIAQLSPRPPKSLRKRERDSIATVIKNISEVVLIPATALMGIFTFIVYLGEADERAMERSLLNLNAKVRAEEVLSALPPLDGNTPTSIARGMEASRSTAYAVEALLLSNGSAAVSTDRANFFCDETSTLTGNLSIASKSTDFIGCDARGLFVEQSHVKSNGDNDELTLSLTFSTWVDSAVFVSTRPVIDRNVLVDIRGATVRRLSMVVSEDDRIQISNSNLQGFELKYWSEGNENVLDFVARRDVTLPVVNIDRLKDDYCVPSTDNIPIEQDGRSKSYWICHFGSEPTGLERWQMRKSHDDELVAMTEGN